MQMNLFHLIFGNITCFTGFVKQLWTQFFLFLQCTKNSHHYYVIMDKLSPQKVQNYQDELKEQRLQIK